MRTPSATPTWLRATATIRSGPFAGSFFGSPKGSSTTAGTRPEHGPTARPAAAHGRSLARSIIALDDDRRGADVRVTLSLLDRDALYAHVGGPAGLGAALTSGLALVGPAGPCVATASTAGAAGAAAGRTQIGDDQARSSSGARQSSA